MKKKLLVAFLSAMIGIQGVLPVMAEEELVPEEIIVEDITEEDQEIFLEEPDLIIEEEPFLEEPVSDPEEFYALEDSLEEEETENVEEDTLSPAAEAETGTVAETDPTVLEEETGASIPAVSLPEDELNDMLESDDLGEVCGTLYSGYCGIGVRWALDDDGTMTISGTGDMWDWTAGDLTPWAGARDKIKKLIFTNSVTKVGDFAFSECYNLTSITMTNTVKSLGKNSFSGCNSLPSVKLPGSLTSIGNDAFNFCTTMESITIPDSVNTIGSGAFLHCKKLKSVTLPQSLKVIEDKTFYMCGGLENVTIPYGVTEIKEAFHGCQKLRSVTIPNSVTKIGSSAFDSCRNLGSVKIGNKVSYIGENAFNWCDSLTAITIPSSVTRIGDYAFSDCSGLKEIIFLGNAPKFEVVSGGSQSSSLLPCPFMGVTATAYYPGENSTWTKQVMQDYAGTITWKPWSSTPAITLNQPKLIAAYNGAKGIGIKFIKEKNAKEYVIWRKENGKWSSVRTIGANSSELQISGDKIMYTDTTVKNNYGKGYIYSVAAKRDSMTTSYDTKGCAIYRLKPPVFAKTVNSAAGTATVYWKGVFGKTETNGNYDLQYAEYSNGKAGTFNSVTKLPGYKYNVLTARVTSLKKGRTYVFRIRCSKTNKDRGTFYSEYSKWLSVTITR